MKICLFKNNGGQTLLNGGSTGSKLHDGMEGLMGGDDDALRAGPDADPIDYLL